MTGLENSENERYKAELSIISFLPYYDKSKKEQYIAFKNNHGDHTWVDVITYVNIGLDIAFYQTTKEINDPDSLIVLVNKYNKLNEDYIPEDLEMINPYYNPYGLFLRHEARIAFEEMCEEANKEEIELKAISTYRGFYYQYKIYLNNITPYQSIDEYRIMRDRVSARPGYSEHQTGLAVDINDLEKTFEDTPEGKWLAEKSYKFGFIMRYPKGKEDITGYDYEPWHFRYVGKELAETVYYSKLTYDEFYARYLYLPEQEVFD